MADQNLTQPEEACPFCRIIRGESPARVIYRDEQCIAFWDKNPKAKVHILIVPLKHIPSVNEMASADEPIIGHLAYVAAIIAKDMGIRDDMGYRLIINTGWGAGQTVFHLHVHLVSGQPSTALRVHSD